MKYFAYGSNMSLNRLRARTPSAQSIGVFMLPCHELRFHKVGRDGSAKCDAHCTGDESHVVEGVVFDIQPDEIHALDAVEGVGQGYEKKQVTVFDDVSNQLTVFMYVATHIDPALQPFCWYREHVLIGARQAGLSPAYTLYLERMDYMKDADHRRRVRELSVHD